MSLSSLTRFSWWYWSNGKGNQPVIGSDSMKPSSKKKKEARLSSSSSSSTKVKKKWQNWSVGWMEPHAPEFFNSDDEDADAGAGAVADNSFAVLVPCYRNDCKAFKMEEQASDQFLNVLTDFPNGFPAEGNKYMEQWLASLQNF
ncbi:hypothetical protein Hdeb2414_s0398g00886091 [Helianthus debilis subsp. tardiflorus]